MNINRRHVLLAAAAALVFPGGRSLAAPPPALTEQLRRGGFVLLMRHASSPANPPEKSAADPENRSLERQLDEKGRQTAAAMGRAFRLLHIPVGAIFSSPTYRARETVRLAGFGTPREVSELGDQGRSMARIDAAGPVRWLKAKVAENPARGTNTLIVTHMPNIAAAFPDLAAGLQDGETLVFQPDGHGDANMIAKVLIEEWGG